MARWGLVSSHMTTLDPFQVFQVEHDPCLNLEINIIRGEDVTKGSPLKDFLDTPDPYVVLKVPGSSNSSRRTSELDNTVHPIWEEIFNFYLDPTLDLTLEITLMDANYTNDEILGEDFFEINQLKLNIPTEHVFNFQGGSKIHSRLTLTKNKYPDLRFSLALCDEEKNFLQLRRCMVLKHMEKLLGVHAPKDVSEVPIMGILGSGGGFRAMACLSGIVKALNDTGIMDCATYIAGLSGSSWYISTLYSHDQFPDMKPDVMYTLLKKAVTQTWKMYLFKSTQYAMDMRSKYSKGQPVSFTDFFGHLLGDVLLEGAKHKKLTHQRLHLLQGTVPFPLYTCLHAKHNVSCRKFSEWVEFSPFEIGIAKYGTFMKTEHFGCKFIVGKMIKQFDELPLHFLQGVWGSAFTILIKRLVNNDKRDNVQIMREEAELELKKDEKFIAGDSDTDDDGDIIGEDDSNSDNCLFMDAVSDLNIDEDRSMSDVVNNLNINQEEQQQQQQHQIQQTIDASIKRKETSMKSSKSEANLTTDSVRKKSKDKKFNFDCFSKKKSLDQTKKMSTESDPGVGYRNGNKRPLSRTFAIKENKSPNKDGIGHSKWTEKRRTFRQKRVEQKKGFFENFKDQLMKDSVILNSRAGRAGEILNPFRGLSLRETLPLSPFNDDYDEPDSSEPDGFHRDCRNKPLDNKAKKLIIVDSGLAFNSPYPLLLRPQRAVDIYLSFDFSARVDDDERDPKLLFNELLLAEKWAQQNKVPFPPIESQMNELIKDNEVREVFVFKHPDDIMCPVILHFPLVNNKFKWCSSPGVSRETSEELDFADFKIFSDPANPYCSTNFTYTELQFDRLVKLTEFNTLYSLETIKTELIDIINKKRQNAGKISTPAYKFTNAIQRVKNLNAFKGRLRLTIHKDKEEQLRKFEERQEDSASGHIFNSSSDSYASAKDELKNGFNF